MQLNLIDDRIRLEIETFEEVLALSIKLFPGMQFLTLAEQLEASDMNSIQKNARVIIIPTEEMLPEMRFAYNNGVYLFRYKNEVYLFRAMAMHKFFKNPFIRGFKANADIFEDGYLHEVSAHVPMSNGEVFISPELQKIWDERKILARFY